LSILCDGEVIGTNEKNKKPFCPVTAAVEDPCQVDEDLQFAVKMPITFITRLRDKLKVRKYF
jgi:hypothetical protein